MLSILFLGVFGVGSSAGGATHKATSLRNVVVVGDSITYLAAGSIEDVVGSRYRTFLVYKVGMRIDQMLPGLGVALLAHAPVSAVVENLGTNDALEGGKNADWRASWARMMSMTAKVPCVVLSTISPAADYFGKRPIASAINREVEELAKTDPRRYKVVDWPGFLHEVDRRHPALFFDYVSRDLIHERQPGARWLAEEDRAALADCGSRAQPSIIPPSKQLLDP